MTKNDNGLATKKDVFEIVAQASDLILKTMEEMFRRQDKKYGERFDKVEREITGLKSGQYEIKKSISDLQVDTPSRGEFNRLKAKVAGHHPTN